MTSPLIEDCAMVLIQARDTNRNFRLNPPYDEEIEAAKYEARVVIPLVVDAAIQIAKQYADMNKGSALMFVQASRDTAKNIAAAIETLKPALGSQNYSDWRKGG